MKGQRLVSEWLTVTQRMNDDFGRVTLDEDRYHNDPVWAAEHSRYGSTIAFGFLTMSLLTYLGNSSIRLAGNAPPEGGHFLNYGFDRLRLVETVRTGDRIRGHYSVREAVVDEKGRTRRVMDVTIEIEGRQRPALVAEWLSVWVPDET